MATTIITEKELVDACKRSDAGQPEPPFVAAAGYAVKPQRGIIPRKLCVEKRLAEILEAIKFYHDGNYLIPVEWFEEAAEIGRWLERQNRKLSGEH